MTSRRFSDNILENKYCNGWIALYKANDDNEQLGSNFYVTNLEAVNKTTLTFNVIYAGVKGKRVEVPGCRLVRQKNNVAFLYFGEQWPFSSEYLAQISSDNIFDVDDLQETWYGFSFEKPYAADRFMFNYFSKYQWLIIAAFVLAFIFFIWKSAYFHLWILVAMAAICLLSVVHSWTLAYPVVLPFSASLILMMIPYIRKYAETIYIYLLVISALFTIYGLWQECGFFLFLWKALYIFVCSMYTCMFSFFIFTKRCSRCGDFTVSGCYRRKEYHAAREVLSIPLNSKGKMAKDPQSIIDSQTENDSNPVCYWCTNN